MNERCMCGDTDCPSCGTAQGTYTPRYEIDPDDDFERERQEELDDEEG